MPRLCCTNESASAHEPRGACRVFSVRDTKASIGPKSARPLRCDRGVPLPTKPVREIAPAHVLDGQQDLLKVPPVIEFVPRIHDGVQCVLIGVQQRLAGPSGVLKDPVAKAGASPAREVHYQYAAIEVGPLLLTSPASLGPTLLSRSEPVVSHRGDWCFAKSDREERREVSPDQDVRV